MLETIGSESHPLFPLVFHEKGGTLKEIIEKVEETLKLNPSIMKHSSILFNSIMHLV